MNCVYDSVQYIDGKVILVEMAGRYGVINDSGKTIVPVRYENIHKLEDGIFAVKQDGKCSILEIEQT